MKKDKSLKFNVEVVKGQCPTCTEHTMLVNIDKEYYRCITCGTDLEQRVNGKISYIPIINTSPKGQYYLHDWEKQSMAKVKFTHFTPRDKPKKRGPRQHKKSLNKAEKRQKSQKRYKGQGQNRSKLSARPKKGTNKQKV